MIKVYGIPNCDTVKKATNWLKAHQIDFVFHNFKTDGLPSEVIAHWLSQRSDKELVNRQSTTWRSLSDDQRAAVVDNASALELMLSNTSVIKRPVITQNDVIVTIGFQEERYQNLFLIP